MTQSMFMPQKKRNFKKTFFLPSMALLFSFLLETEGCKDGICCGDSHCSFQLKAFNEALKGSSMKEQEEKSYEAALKDREEDDNYTIFLTKKHFEDIHNKDAKTTKIRLAKVQKELTELKKALGSFKDIQQEEKDLMILENINKGFEAVTNIMEQKHADMIHFFLSADGEKIFGFLKDGVEKRVASLLEERLKLHEEEKNSLKASEEEKRQDYEKRLQEHETKIQDVLKEKEVIERKLKDQEESLLIKEKIILKKDADHTLLSQRLIDLATKVTNDTLLQDTNLILREKVKDFDKLQEEKNEKEKALRDMEEKMKLFQEEKTKLMDEKSSLEKTLEEKTKGIEDFAAQIVKIKEEHQEEKTKLEQKYKEDLNRIHDGHENRIQELKDQYHEEKEKLISNNDSIQKTLQAMKERVEFLESAIKQDQGNKENPAKENPEPKKEEVSLLQDTASIQKV